MVDDIKKAGEVRDIEKSLPTVEAAGSSGIVTIVLAS